MKNSRAADNAGKTLVAKLKYSLQDSVCLSVIHEHIPTRFKALIGTSCLFGVLF